MSQPSLVVNKKSTIKFSLIFNESNLIGRHKNKESWNNSAVIDVYSTFEQKYIGSFYLPKPKEIKKIQFMITDHYLIVLIGNEIVRSRFAQNLFFTIDRITIYLEIQIATYDQSDYSNDL